MTSPFSCPACQYFLKQKIKASHEANDPHPEGELGGRTFLREGLIKKKKMKLVFLATLSAFVAGSSAKQLSLRANQQMYLDVGEHLEMEVCGGAIE